MDEIDDEDGVFASLIKEPTEAAQEVQPFCSIIP